MHACIILGLWEHAIPTACDVESDNGRKAFVCCMHIVLLKGYLERQPRMARAGGDLGHAMRCCLAFLPNQVTY
jgi:hypothetical protein